MSYSLAVPLDAAKTARALIGDDLDREVFGILLVNTRHRVTAMYIVSVGRHAQRRLRASARGL